MFFNTHCHTGWHVDVGQFLLDNGADVNKSDKYGRCPLHVAAADDYEIMVDFLLKNGAEVNQRTLFERQTPMHYAAKNNAVSAMKVRYHDVIFNRSNGVQQKIYLALYEFERVRIPL